MGKEKKSGVERLVQFLYDGSPHMSKRMGLAPGLDDDKTGDGATAHAWNNRTHSPAVLNWQKDVAEDSLNHKKTSRPLEDALKTAQDNEPHVNMGLPGGIEAGIKAGEPRDDNVTPVGNAKTRRAPDWGKYNSYVQKAANEGTTMTSPTENQPATGPHPQQQFVERVKDDVNASSPNKDAVTKENDMQKRIKQYDNKEDEGNEPYQPEGSMAASGMGGYPSGATMQMSSFGMNTYEQDSLVRGGAKDTEDPDITQEESDAMWIPEAEKVAKLEAMRKMLEDSGDATPLISALFAVDGE